jgi:hypothetical protein
MELTVISAQFAANALMFHEKITHCKLRGADRIK